MQSFPNKFMLREDSSFRGLLNYPSNNEDIAPHNRHRSYFNQVSFLVKSIKNNKLSVLSASELFKKQDQYLVYTVERGFQNLPLKKIDLPSNVLWHLICNNGKSSYGIFHNQSRIVEERNIIRFKQHNGVGFHVIEPLFLVEARMDKTFYNVLKDKQQKITIIHNVPFKNRTGIDFYPGFLPTTNNTPNEKFGKIQSIMELCFPTLSSFQENEKKHYIGKLFQYIGLYYTDGKGDPRPAEIYLSADEKELSHYLLELIKVLSESQDCRESLLMSKKISHSKRERKEVSKTNTFSKLSQEGFKLCQRTVVANQNTNFPKMLLDLRLSMNYKKVISNLLYPEDLPTYYLYKFFEGLLQGDGTLDKRDRYRLSFTQAITEESHEQILHQGLLSGLLLGFSIHTKLDTKKHESGVITQFLTLTFKGRSNTIMESEGLEKKRFPLSFKERQTPTPFSFIPLQRNEIKEMYYFDIDHTSFITTEGVMFQNSETHLFAARTYDSDNSFKFQYHDDYKTLHSTVMRQLLDDDYDDFAKYRKLITMAENIVTEIAGKEFKNFKHKHKNFKCSHCSYKGSTKALYEKHISRCNPKQVSQLYMDPFFYSSVHDPIDSDEEQYSFIVGELDCGDDSN